MILNIIVYSLLIIASKLLTVWHDRNVDGINNMIIIILFYLSCWSTSAAPLQLGHFQLRCSVNNPSETSWDSKMTGALIKDSFAEPSQKARFMASVAPHSGDWLLALFIANCGLRLDDEAVRVAVGMRLGLALCAPHSCPRGDQVDAQGLHAMKCKKAPGRIARH